MKIIKQHKIIDTNERNRDKKIVFEYILHNSILLSRPLAIALVADTENPY